MNPYSTFYRLDEPVFQNRFVKSRVWVEEIVLDPKHYGGVFYTENYITLGISALLKNAQISTK
jgi:hypothetical protein